MTRQPSTKLTRSQTIMNNKYHYNIELKQSRGRDLQRSTLHHLKSFTATWAKRIERPWRRISRPGGEYLKVLDSTRTLITPHAMHRSREALCWFGSARTLQGSSGKEYQTKHLPRLSAFFQQAWRGPVSSVVFKAWSREGGGAVF